MQKQPAQTSGFARLLATILALVLVIVLPLALLAFNVGQTMFNQPLVKRVVTEELVNSDLMPAALEWFSERRAQQRMDNGEALAGTNEPDIVLLLSFMDANDWRLGKNEWLTNDMLTDWTATIVDGAYAWIDSNDRLPQISLNMTPLKARLNSAHGTNGIMIAYNNLPPCNQAQVDDFKARRAKAPVGSVVQYNLCNFPEPDHTDQVRDYQNSLNDVVKNIPDQFSLSDQMTTLGSDFEGIKAQLRLVRTLGSLAWIAPLVLLLLILALAVRNLPALSRWWGIPLWIGAALGILPVVIFPGLVTNFLADGLLSKAPALIKAETTRAVLRVLGEILNPMLIESMILMVVALVLIAVMFLRRSKPEPVATVV
jgi:hypothetical protein